MRDACCAEESHAAEISLALFELTRARHIPLIGTIELTHRCNLFCKHCYFDDSCRIAGPDEMSTEEVKKAMDQLSAAGALYLIFTGGEIFLRPDIFELCRYARARSFDLRLFTNATRISADDCGRIGELTITRLEASVYGRPETHDMITKVPGSWQATTGNLRRLAAAGVPVSIKTPLMTLNYADLPWLRETGKQWGIPVQTDPVIVPKNSGDAGNLRYRLDAGQLGEVYAMDGKQRPAPSAGGSDFICSAGLNMASIGPDGTVYPCLQLLLPLGNLRSQAFSAIWSDENPIISRYRALTLEDMEPCRECPHTPYCQRCPGLALLEDGSITGPSRISCLTAQIQHDISLVQ